MQILEVYHGWREKTDILQVLKLHLLSLGRVEKHWCQNRGVDLSSLFIGGWIWRHPGPFLGIFLHDPMGQNPPPRIWHNGCRDVQSHLFWNNIFVKSFNLIASYCTGLYQTNAFQKPSCTPLLCPMYYKLFDWSCCYIKEFYFNEKQFDWYKILEKERMQENILKLLVYFVKLKKTFKSKQLV